MIFSFLIIHNRVSFFLFASKVFLIAILLGTTSQPQILVTGGPTGPLGSTYPLLFRLKGFFINSDQYIQTSLYEVYLMAPEI